MVPYRDVVGDLFGFRPKVVLVVEKMPSGGFSKPPKNRDF